VECYADRKEALAKALGVGLACGLDMVVPSESGNPLLPRGEAPFAQCVARSIPVSREFATAITVLGSNEFRLRLWGLDAAGAHNADG
jgi:phosphopantetheinyl transferase